MAIRQIRLDGDPILRKKSREVDEVTDRIVELLEDMDETMHHADGVGLAAPQIGILKRVIVVNDGSGRGTIKMVNPVILESEGCLSDMEGCLSVPNRNGLVDRPSDVKVKYLNENGEELVLEAKGFLARIICHETDHLDGILYIDKMTEEIFLEEDGE